jgi:hypothetical protein
MTFPIFHLNDLLKIVVLESGSSIQWIDLPDEVETAVNAVLCRVPDYLWR